MAKEGRPTDEAAAASTLPRNLVKHGSRQLAKFAVAVAVCSWLLCRESTPLQLAFVQAMHCNPTCTAPQLHVHMKPVLHATGASSSVWANLPVAITVVGALAWALTPDTSGATRLDGWRQRRAAAVYMRHAWQLPGVTGSAKLDARWRDKVRAPLVEHAWETLCGSIIQEVKHLVDRRTDFIYLSCLRSSHVSLHCC